MDFRLLGGGDDVAHANQIGSDAFAGMTLAHMYVFERSRVDHNVRSLAVHDAHKAGLVADVAERLNDLSVRRAGRARLGDLEQPMVMVVEQNERLALEVAGKPSRKRPSDRAGSASDQHPFSRNWIGCDLASGR